MPDDSSKMDEEQLKELKTLVKENETAMQKLKNEVETIGQYFEIMENYLYNIDDVIFANYWGLKEWPQTIKEALSEATRIIQESELKLAEKLELEKKKF